MELPLPNNVPLQLLETEEGFAEDFKELLLSELLWDSSPLKRGIAQRLITEKGYPVTLRQLGNLLFEAARTATENYEDPIKLIVSRGLNVSSPEFDAMLEKMDAGATKVKTFRFPQHWNQLVKSNSAALQDMGLWIPGQLPDDVKEVLFKELREGRMPSERIRGYITKHPHLFN